MTAACSFAFHRLLFIVRKTLSSLSFLSPFCRRSHTKLWPLETPLRLRFHRSHTAFGRSTFPLSPQDATSHAGAATAVGKLCEGCGLKQSGFGLPASDSKAGRWCDSCASTTTTTATAPGLTGGKRPADGPSTMINGEQPPALPRAYGKGEAGGAAAAAGAEGMEAVDGMPYPAGKRRRTSSFASAVLVSFSEHSYEGDMFSI